MLNLTLVRKFVGAMLGIVVGLGVWQYTAAEMAIVDAGGMIELTSKQSPYWDCADEYRRKGMSSPSCEQERLYTRNFTETTDHYGDCYGMPSSYSSNDSSRYSGCDDQIWDSNRNNPHVVSKVVGTGQTIWELISEQVRVSEPYLSHEEHEERVFGMVRQLDYYVDVDTVQPGFIFVMPRKTERHGLVAPYACAGWCEEKTE